MMLAVKVNNFCKDIFLGLTHSKQLRYSVLQMKQSHTDLILTCDLLITSLTPYFLLAPVLKMSKFIVRGDRDSRATLMPIYGDLYQIKL